MIQMQDAVVFDIQEPIQEQRIVTYNQKSSIVHTTTYQVKSPKKPKIVKPQTDTISPAIDYIIDKLKNGTATDKSKAIAFITKNLETKSAPQYLDAGITEALFYVVDEDISKLKSCTKQQEKLRKKIEQEKKVTKKQVKIAFELTEKETAKLNKVRALCTIAKIQNVLFVEMKKRTDLKPKLSDMPAVPKLIDESKNNPDNDVKAAAIGALYLMKRPEFEKDLNIIFEEAKKSEIPQIREYATKALDKK